MACGGLEYMSDFAPARVPSVKTTPNNPPWLPFAAVHVLTKGTSSPHLPNSDPKGGEKRVVWRRPFRTQAVAQHRGRAREFKVGGKHWYAFFSLAQSHTCASNGLPPLTLILRPERPTGSAAGRCCESRFEWIADDACTRYHSGNSTPGFCRACQAAGAPDAVLRAYYRRSCSRGGPRGVVET